MAKLLFFIFVYMCVLISYTFFFLLLVSFYKAFKQVCWPFQHSWSSAFVVTSAHRLFHVSLTFQLFSVTIWNTASVHSGSISAPYTFSLQYFCHLAIYSYCVAWKCIGQYRIVLWCTYYTLLYLLYCNVNICRQPKLTEQLVISKSLKDPRCANQIAQSSGQGCSKNTNHHKWWPYVDLLQEHIVVLQQEPSNRSQQEQCMSTGKMIKQIVYWTKHVLHALYCTLDP